MFTDQAIRRTIDKKTVEVFQLFNEELNTVKKEFNNKAQELPPMHPKFAGIAYWARMLKRRIDKPMLVNTILMEYSLCI
jgi:dynein heavy chain